MIGLKKGVSFDLSIPGKTPLSAFDLPTPGRDALVYPLTNKIKLRANSMPSIPFWGRNLYLSNLLKIRILFWQGKKLGKIGLGKDDEI